MRASEETDDSLRWLLIRISLFAKQQLIAISEKHDLTVMQLFTLLLLEPGVQAPMHSISGMLGCDPSNVTGIVDRLAAAGFIERRESSLDRRVKAISLTASGIASREKILRAIAKGKMPDLSALSEAEGKTLKKLLSKVAAA